MPRSPILPVTLRLGVGRCCGQTSTWNDLTLTEYRIGATLAESARHRCGRADPAYRHALTGGLVLHASALDDNGKGIVFVGHSGAGKSTQVDLWSREPGVTA